jgi:competence CoiA-like predicted nuclease
MSHLGIARRADLLVELATGETVAIELQHSAIGPEELAQRSRDYLTAGIALLWLPLTTIDPESIE